MGYVAPFIKEPLSEKGKQTVSGAPKVTPVVSSGSSKGVSSGGSSKKSSGYVSPVITQNLSPTMQQIVSGEPGALPVGGGSTVDKASGPVTSGSSVFVGPPAPSGYQSQQPVVQEKVVSESPIPNWLRSGIAQSVVNPTQTYKLKATGEYISSERQKYVQSGVVPSWLSSQITVPYAIGQAGASSVYTKLAVENFFGGFNTKQTSYQFSKALGSSYWYMSTQPIWKESASSDKLLTFSELQAKEPALYLMQGTGGVWSPKFDVVRWRGESEKNLGYGGTVASRAAEIPLSMFDIDYYFAENKKEYLALKLYESSKSVRSGDWSRIAGSWGSVQVPAYTNFILPAAGGFAFGKVFTGVKLAGGFGKASSLLKAGYVGAMGYGAAGLGVTGYQFATQGISSSSLVKLGFGALVGSVGYMGGASSAVSAFKSQYPNISWGREGIPIVGEKYVSFAHEKISGSGLGGKTVVPYRYGFYKISQLFKPSGEVRQYIGFPKSPSSFGAKGSLTMFSGSTGTTNTMIGYAEGAGKTFKTWWGGQRAYSYRSAWGMQKQAVVGLESLEGVSYGGTLKMSTGKFPVEIRSIYGDVSAMQSVIPGLRFAPKSFISSGLSFQSPVFSYVPSGIGSFISPIVSPIKSVDRVSSLKSVFEIPKFEFDVDQRFGYLGDVSSVSGNVVGNVPKFEYESSFRYRSVFPDVSSITKPYSVMMPKLGLGSSFVARSGLVSVGKKSFVSIKSSEVTPISVPSRWIGGYGGGAGGSWDKILRKGYRFRKHKVPTLEDILKGW